MRFRVHLIRMGYRGTVLLQNTRLLMPNFKFEISWVGELIGMGDFATKPGLGVNEITRWHSNIEGEGIYIEDTHSE